MKAWGWFWNLSQENAGLNVKFLISILYIENTNKISKKTRFIIALVTQTNQIYFVILITLNLQDNFSNKIIYFPNNLLSRHVSDTSVQILYLIHIKLETTCSSRQFLFPLVACHSWKILITHFVTDRFYLGMALSNIVFSSSAIL